jgi:hypothetical protein
MILLIMGRSRARRSAVAAGLAQQLGLDHVHVADDSPAADERAAALRARLQATPAAGRRVVYSAPPVPIEACAGLREVLRGLELVRLKHEDEELRPLPGALTLDADMADDVLIATIRAVLRI